MTERLMLPFSCRPDFGRSLVGNSDGSFPVPNLLSGSNPSYVTMADVNGDGIADLVVANSGDNTVSVLGQAPTFAQAAFLLVCPVGEAFLFVVFWPSSATARVFLVGRARA